MRSGMRRTTNRSAETTRTCARSTRTTTRPTRLRVADVVAVTREEQSSRVTPPGREALARGGSMREREAKLLASPGFRLPALDGVVEGVRIASDECVELCAVYFDTPDLRLTRSGASLRYRSEHWTV